jgi:hypothetical protein
MQNPIRHPIRVLSKDILPISARHHATSLVSTRLNPAIGAPVVHVGPLHKNYWPPKQPIGN